MFAPSSFLREHRVVAQETKTNHKYILDSSEGVMVQDLEASGGGERICMVFLVWCWDFQYSY